MKTFYESSDALSPPNLLFKVPPSSLHSLPIFLLPKRLSFPLKPLSSSLLSYLNTVPGLGTDLLQTTSYYLFPKML